MTTIANYNVNLSMDANSYIDSTRLSRRETSSLQRTINSTRTPAEKYERTVRQLDNALERGAISQGTYNNLLEKQAQKFEKTSRSANKASGAFRKFAGVLAAIGVSRFGKESASLSMQMEQVAVRFEVLTKSAGKAQYVLAEIRKFAASTPFQFTELSDAGVQLLATGSAATQLIKELRMLGDIASGAGIPIGELANIYGRARTQQTLYADELNKFTDRGINVLKSFAEQLGIDETQVKKFASEGKISFENLRIALEELTSEGGDFDGMTSKLAETTGGKLSTAMDQLKDGMIQMGDAFSPVIISLTEGFEDGQSAVQGMVFLVEKLADAADFAVAGFRDTIRITTEFYKGIANFDFTGFMDASQFDAVNAMLDRMDKRDQERANAGNQDAINASIEAEEKKRLAMEKKIQEEKDRKAKIAADAEEKAAKSLRDIWGDIGKQAEEFSKQLELGQKALENARNHLAEERQRAIKRRQDIVSQMSKAGQEVGSGQDVAFMARLQNAELAAQSVTEPTEPTEEQLLDETKRQYELLKQEAAESKKQTAKLTELIKAVEENKIKPIR